MCIRTLLESKNKRRKIDKNKNRFSFNSVSPFVNNVTENSTHKIDVLQKASVGVT